MPLCEECMWRKIIFRALFRSEDVGRLLEVFILGICEGVWRCKCVL
jgi:membrane protease YdiL (CAAX protease family)